MRWHTRTASRAATLLALVLLAAGSFQALAAPAGAPSSPAFPPSLASYLAGEEGRPLLGVLQHPVSVEPLNGVATAVFLLAILHTFLAPRLLAASHHLRDKLARERGGEGHSFWVEVLHFLEEIEAVFGICVVPLLIAIEAVQGYLASLVPVFSEAAKYAVVAGAVAGGGLTVIANAPNPAGQSTLARYFPDGVSPGGLFLGALLPTVLVASAFLFLP